MIQYAQSKPFSFCCLHTSRNGQGEKTIGKFQDMKVSCLELQEFQNASEEAGSGSVINHHYGVHVKPIWC